MNIITSTDSPLLYSRLYTILSDLPGVEIISVAKDLDEAKDIIGKSNIQVLIIAFHNLQKTAFKKLKEIKESNYNLSVIVLTNNFAEQYLVQWHNAGADYVFDQALQFNKIIDVLSGQIYKNLLGVLKSDKLHKKKLKITITNNSSIKEKR
jgi:DNA-binding NarL/FixJ family response regulator